ncbi:MAG: hypothetical protein ACQEXJ_09315 [Myxococcota bacterium]
MAAPLDRKEQPDELAPPRERSWRAAGEPLRPGLAIRVAHQTDDGRVKHRQGSLGPCFRIDGALWFACSFHVVAGGDRDRPVEMHTAEGWRAAPELVIPPSEDQPGRSEVRPKADLAFISVRDEGATGFVDEDTWPGLLLASEADGKRYWFEGLQEPGVHLASYVGHLNDVYGDAEFTAKQLRNLRRDCLGVLQLNQARPEGGFDGDSGGPVWRATGDDIGIVGHLVAAVAPRRRGLMVRYARAFDYVGLSHDDYDVLRGVHVAG